MTWFCDSIRQLRAHYQRPDPADTLTWHAGDAAQCTTADPNGGRVNSNWPHRDGLIWL